MPHKACIISLILFSACRFAHAAEKAKTHAIGLNVGPIIALVDVGAMYETRILPFVWADIELNFRMFNKEKIDAQNSRVLNNTYMFIACAKYRPSDTLNGFYVSLCPALYHDEFVIRNSAYNNQNRYQFLGIAGGPGLGYSILDGAFFMNMGIELLFSASRDLSYEFPEASFRNSYPLDPWVRMSLILAAGYAF